MQRLNNKNILLISPSAWGKSFVSKHHYAMELARRGNKVFFLNPPAEKNQVREVGENLFVVDHKPRFRGLRKLPAFMSAFLTRLELKALQKLTTCSFDLIWSFDTSRFFDLGNKKSFYSILHLVDFTENLNLPRSASSYQLALGTTDFITGNIRTYNPNVHKVHHGYHAMEEQAVSWTFPEGYGRWAGYVGNLSIKYLDWEIVFEMAKRHPDTGFCFVGPEGKSNLSPEEGKADEYLQKIKALPNTFFPGAKPAHEVPAFLKACDVLLVAYKAQEYKEQLASPHKLMEYLGSGNVIVSSYTDEYKDKPGLLEMAQDKKELLKKFGQVIENLAFYNSEEKQNLRRSFAAAHTYKHQVDRIEALIAHE